MGHFCTHRTDPGAADGKIAPVEDFLRGVHFVFP